MPSTRQENSFASDLSEDLTLKSSALDSAIKWIEGNLKPDEVFPDKPLIEWVASNKTPDEVFPEKELIEWAENHGYVKSTE